MKTYLNRCFSVVVLLFLQFVRVSTQPRNQRCKFPHFLGRDKLWHSGGEFESENMYFNEDRIIIGTMPFGSRVDRRCDEIIDREKGIYFVVEDRYHGDEKKVFYLCMQFLKRSDSVVQIRESYASTMKSKKGCSEQSMVLINRLFVRHPFDENQSVKCPFSGGYNLKIAHKMKSVCGSSVIPPRLESECEDGDGVTLDFRIKECKLDNDHNLEENFRCLASWTDKTAENNYTFVVLTANLWFPVCMRLEGNLSDLKRANIFRKGTCVVNDRDSLSKLAEYVDLGFEKMVVSNFCENEIDNCTQELTCSKYQNYCHKSCRKCHTKTNACSFPEFLIGQWHTDFKGVSSVIDISTYNFHLPVEGNFKCVGKVNSTEDNAYRLTLLHIFENGCFPRTTCFEYKKTYNMILHYKFGKRVKWPVFPLDKMIDDTCQDVLLDIPYSVAINGAQINTTNCRLPGDFGFKSGHLYIRNSKGQDYCIAYNEYSIGRSDKFNMVDINTTEPINMEHLCLSSEKRKDGSVFVITSSLSDRSYTCWGFIGKEQSRSIVQLSLEDCNEKTFDSLHNGYTTPLNSFVVIEDPKNVCTESISAGKVESGSRANSATFSLFMSSFLIIMTI